MSWCDPTERVGATLYVNGEPCWTCAKLIAGSGIETVVYQPEGGLRPQGVEFLGRYGIAMVPIEL